MKRSPPPAPLSAILLAAALILPACTSSQDVLEPSALVGGAAATQQPAPAFPLPAPAATASTQQPATVAAIQTDARVQFAPVVGAPAGASTPLAARLSARAGARGISLVGAGNGQTTVIYVWDVVDPAGTRIHRIQGQAKAPSSGGDGWEDVQPATMESIADETVDRLAAWLSGRQG